MAPAWTTPRAGAFPSEAIVSYPPLVDGESTCAKCGYRAMHYMTYDARAAASFDSPEGVVGEHIVRRCFRCRFEWREACVTSPAPNI